VARKFDSRRFPKFLHREIFILWKSSMQDEELLHPTVLHAPRPAGREAAKGGQRHPIECLLNKFKNLNIISLFDLKLKEIARVKLQKER
jgi:hypothetical protein